MVGNLVLPRRAGGAVKRDFRTSEDIPPQMKILSMVILPNALLQFCLKLGVASSQCKQCDAAFHLCKRDINDVELFPTVNAGYTDAHMFGVIQSEVALQRQVH